MIDTIESVLGGWFDKSLTDSVVLTDKQPRTVIVVSRCRMNLTLFNGCEHTTDTFFIGVGDNQSNQGVV